ncbi:SRPBCC domain-containing protein [Ramlibacter sp.]|uniref:SRPBCC family protein n=1 Tax=Ramlibacter sp. TaxID=1917967 RepID=UPI0035B3101B
MLLLSACTTPASLPVAQPVARAVPNRPPVVNEAVIAAPRAVVWQAWTTAEGLRSWLAPHADIDLRLGGLMRSNYNPAGALGDAGTIENRILAYEPQRMLAIQVARAPERFPFPNAIRSMWTVIHLDDADGGHTRVRAVSMGFTDDDESARMRAFFERGNAYTLQQLQQRFAVK